jgi:RNA methyltransferase, TrmH family
VTDPISSRQNAKVQHARRVAQDGAYAREQGLFWIDGDHLVAAAFKSGWRMHTVFTSRDFRAQDLVPHRLPPPMDATLPHLLVTEDVMRAISTLDSPPWIAALVVRPSTQAVQVDAPTVVLDRLQDPGNVGSILRSAAAFGFTQVLALQGTVSLWSTKVLRAAMGAHANLHLHERLLPSDLGQLNVPLLGTSSHANQPVDAVNLPKRCAWVFGHEGQGVDEGLLKQCQLVVHIEQPAGQESLNVAAAAAICLHASRPR